MRKKDKQTAELLVLVVLAAGSVGSAGHVAADATVAKCIHHTLGDRGGRGMSGCDFYENEGGTDHGLYNQALCLPCE
jgi:hypothetical protein